MVCYTIFMEVVVTIIGLFVIASWIAKMDARYLLIGAIWYVLLSVCWCALSIVVASLLSAFVYFLPVLVRFIKRPIVHS